MNEHLRAIRGESIAALGARLGAVDVLEAYERLYSLALAGVRSGGTAEYEQLLADGITLAAVIADRARLRDTKPAALSTATES